MLPELTFAEVVAPRWQYAADAAIYPTAVISGEVLRTNGGDFRASAILIPAPGSGKPPKQWRLYASEVDLTYTSLLAEDVTELMRQVQAFYRTR